MRLKKRKLCQSIKEQNVHNAEKTKQICYMMRMTKVKYFITRCKVPRFIKRLLSVVVAGIHLKGNEVQSVGWTDCKAYM